MMFGKEVSLSDLKNPSPNHSESLVSVIVLNWNRKALLKRCLDAVLRQTYGEIEVLLVDNASKDGSPDYVREHYPQVRLIENKANLGFCGGNNVGINHARGNYIVLVNNDAFLDPECVEEMMKTIQRDPKIGAVATKILLEDQPTHLDAAGIGVCLDGLSIGRGRMEHADEYNEEKEVFFVSDCVCLYRKEMLTDIGLYDEDFFAYAEETDMGWRARLKGWKTFYNPRAIASHTHSSSLGAYNSFKVFLVERNRIWVAIKNLPFPFLIQGLFYTLQRYFFQTVGAFTGRGAAGEFTKSLSKWELASILIKAHLSAWLRFPKMLGKRHKILSEKRISTADIRQLFNDYGFSAKEIAFKC